MLSIDDVRTAHSEGPTFAAYYSQENSVVTAGSDGDIRVYPGLYDEESFSRTLGLKITSLAVQDDIVVIATEFHEVKSYKLPELEILQNILLRFSSPINYVCISIKKEICAAASSDFDIKTANMDGLSQKTFAGHSAPVLSLCFTSDSEGLISNSCDGTIRVWSIIDQKCTKVLDILPKSNSASEFLGVMSSYGKILAVPIGNNIKLLSTQTWNDENSQLKQQHSEKVSFVAISTFGNFLASGTSNGELFTWNLTNKSLIKKYVHPHNKGITSLAWKEKANEILFANIDGEFGFVEVSAKNIDIDGDVGGGVNDHKNQESKDDKEEDVLSAKKAKKRVIENNDYPDNDDNLLSSAKKRHRVNNLDNFLDDDDENNSDDDDPNISLNLIKEGLLPKLNKVSVVNENEDSISSIHPIPESKEVAMPSLIPFQPSSTPAHLMHRFLVWNSVGIIRCHSEDEVSSIEIEFHNASTHYPLHIANVLNNTMGTLSNTAVVLAAEKDGDTPSKVSCHHFSTWDDNKEWSLSLPLTESIQVIAANDSYVVLATNQQYLRFITIGGIQTQINHIPGSVVTMAMHEKQLLVVYKRAGGYNNCVCLGLLSMHFSKNEWEVHSDSPLNLKEHCSLVWLGFSKEGSPIFVDSSGDVFLWHRKSSFWVPVANTRQQAKNKADNFWVIGVEEKEGKIRCILCKGANIPSTLPRPVPTVIPFQIPLCEITSEKSVKESELLKTELILSNMKSNENLFNYTDDDLGVLEKQQIALLMQLFALACKSDRDFRAVEVCQLMPNVESIGLAIQYATKMRKMNLAQKLDDLARERASICNQENEVEEEEFFSESDSLGFDELSENETDVRTDLNTVEKPVKQRLNVENDQSSEIHKINFELPKDSKKISIQSLKIVADGREARGNPFKVEKSSEAAIRGTHRFETIETKTKKKTEDEPGLKKKPTNTGQRKIVLPSKTKKTTERVCEEESSKKKVSGFQLFLEEKQGGQANESEEVLTSAMKEWKAMSAEEKQKWNNNSILVKTEEHCKNKETKINDDKKINVKDTEDVKKEINESKKKDTKENIKSKKDVKQNREGKKKEVKEEKKGSGDKRDKKNFKKAEGKVLTEKNIKPSSGSTTKLKAFAFNKNDN